MQIQSRDIVLKARGKDFHCYLSEPHLGAGGPGILLLHAWWGLKPFFKETCDRIAEQGFIVLAPDLRDGQIAQTVDEAQQMMDKSDKDQTSAYIQNAKNYLLHYPSRIGRKIAVIGFSMGAAWALDVAADRPQHVAAAVMFYGASDVDASRLDSLILGHFSDVDEWEPYDGIKALEKKLLAAGVNVEFFTYPGKAHWFVEEDRPEYDAAAARLAWNRTFAFLHQNFPA